MLRTRIAAILAVSLFLISCSSSTTVPAAPNAPAPPSGAPQQTNVPPNPNANVVGAFSKTDPQLTPVGIQGDAGRGEKLFGQKGIECDGCHDVTKSFPGGDFGPNQGNVSIIAQGVLKSPDYKGKAKTVAEYIRESILAPNVYILPGDDYHEKDGSSAMKLTFSETLTPQQVEDLIAYLMSLNVK